MPLKLVSNPVASNLKDSCAKVVGSNDDNIASIEIIDLTSEQVEYSIFTEYKRECLI